jgi:integrase
MQGCAGQEWIAMPVKQAKNGRWRYREVVRLPDGTRERIFGSAPKHINTKVAAQKAMLDHVDRLLHPERQPQRKETPTFKVWFDGRFWNEWVLAENKPSERAAKRSIFDTHLDPFLGEMPLDEINAGVVQRLRAHLVAKKDDDGKPALGAKRINNVMAVLSKALRYAVDAEVIKEAPRIRFKRIERPEIEAWSFEEYARVLQAAREESPEWYVAACLAGEAGLRVGEIRALRWREDVDLVAGTITINQQSWKGHEGTPKGRTRRTVPMTETMLAALKALSVVRTGYVVRNLDGKPMRDAQTSHATYRICRRAGLPERGWHVLRHSFGTHSASFGINPWQLMEWMGHKRIDETMGYVHFAERHARAIPPELIAVGEGKANPSARVLAMLGARGNAVAKREAGGAVSTVSSTA